MKGGSILAAHALLSRIGDLCLVFHYRELVTAKEPRQGLLARRSHRQGDCSANDAVVGEALRSSVLI